MSIRGKPFRRPAGGTKAVIIGGSAGGTEALTTILSQLPSTFPVPIIIVCHIPADDEGRFAEHIAMISPIPTSEAQDKESITAPHIYVAPANYHLLVEWDGTLALSIDPKVNWARPSIDVLFESAARSWGDGVICVVLSGANHDGAEGVRLVSRLGGVAIAQKPSTAKHAVMPAAAIARAEIELILPPSEIGDFLRQVT